MRGHQKKISNIHIIHKKGNKIMETMNHEYYVSSEIAKLLEKAGFDWKCRKCYNKGVLFDMEPDEIRTQTPQHSSYDVLAPTLDVAQRWLREVKNCYTGIDVFVRNLDKNNTYYNRWFVYFNGARYSGSNYDDTQYYEDAQEAGIKKALEIINKGE